MWAQMAPQCTWADQPHLVPCPIAPPRPKAPDIPPVPSLLPGGFPIWGPSLFGGHTPPILFGATENTSIPFPASAGRAAAYSQTSSPPQFKSESHPEGLPCARHQAQAGSKPEPLVSELAPRGGRDPVAGSAKPPQELRQELSPEGCGGIGKVKTGGLPGGGSGTAEGQRRQVGRWGRT